MTKKKILHIIQSLDSGGCEHMLLRTLPRLDGFEHHILTLKELGELAPRFSETGITVNCMRQRGFWDWESYRRLRKTILMENPDIVITYLFHADMLGRLFLRRYFTKPIIPFLRTTYNHPRYLAARIMEKLTKSLVSRYLANSEAVKDFYMKRIGVNPEKITVIPNSIDTSVYKNADGSKIVKELNLPEHRFVITCVANLAVNKGHQYLLEAFDQIYKSYPQVYLLLAGDGDERENLEKQIRNYTSKNHIFFLGQRQDVPNILKASDCFVLPTLFEGMSNALLEAMAAGLPVITTDIPENSIWLNQGETAILVPSRSSESLKRAIVELMENAEKRNLLGKNARAMAAERFGLDAVAGQWRDCLSAYQA